MESYTIGRLNGDSQVLGAKDLGLPGKSKFIQNDRLKMSSQTFMQMQ